MTIANRFANRAAKSMAAQLDRVNNDPAKLREKIADLEETVARMREELKLLRSENLGLRETIDLLPEDHPGIRHLANWDKRKIGNRPVLTIAEAARQAGCTYWTAYRSVTVYQDWSAIQTDDRQWLVYADQPLNVKVRKSKKGKKK